MPPPEPARRADRFDRRLIWPMVLGSILNPINSTMLAVALVPIGLSLGAPPAATAWLVAALYLATAVGQPVAGRLIDAFGPKGVYLIAAFLVGAGGLLGALTPGLGWLVAARVVIGLGTCAAYPSAMFLLRSEAARTGRDSPAGVLAALSVANQAVAVVGPALGGLLIGIGGWRAIFLVNVPLSVGCLALGAWLLPRGAGVVVREPRAAGRFGDLRTMARNAPLIATYLRQLLGATSTYLMLYGLPQWLEAGRGLSPSEAGLVILPMFATAIGVTVATGRRRELRAKLLAGSLALVAAGGLVTQVDPRSPTWLLVAIAVVFGVPQGLLGLANQNAVYFQANPARVASAAGLLRTCHYLGAIASSAIAAAVFGERVTTAGAHVMAWVILGCGAALTVTALVDRSLGRASGG